MAQKIFDTKGLLGLKYGRLTILEIMPYKTNKHTNYVVMVKCKCDCGNEVVTRYRSIRYKQTFSCGCFHKEIVSNNSIRHGLSKHKLYKVWACMKDRCLNNKNKRYIDYGGRGILVCDLWANNFKAYYDWCIGNGWVVGLEIDRIDNDGSYEPNNCRIVTHIVNKRNRRGNRKITINGVTKLLVEWSEFSGIGSKTLQGRLDSKWSDDKLLSPIDVKCRKKSYKQKV